MVVGLSCQQDVVTGSVELFGIHVLLRDFLYNDIAIRRGCMLFGDIRPEYVGSSILIIE